MCSAILYITSACLVASVLGNQEQWTQYNIPQGLQGFLPQQDQQVQASEFNEFSGQGLENHGDSGAHDFGGGGFEGGHNFGGSGFEGGHNFGGHGIQAHSYPVHQHVEEENPEPIKHYKEVVVPVHKNFEFKIHQPIIIPVPHQVPIQIPVPKAVVIPVVKEVSVPVEKSVPYPVEKIVHVPKIKEVPFEVVKHIIVPVPKPYPFKVPVHETIIHTKKGSHKI